MNLWTSRPLPLRQAQGSLEPTENAEKTVKVKVLGSFIGTRKAGGPDATASGHVGRP